MRTLIPAAPRLDLLGVFSYLRAHAVPGVEVADRESYARALSTPDGTIILRVRLTEPGLELETWGATAEGHAVVEARIRRLFDLDADTAAIDSALAAHPLIAPLVAARPGVRVPRAFEAEEALVRAIVGQQISLAAARLAMTELSVIGDRVESPIEGIVRLAPTATQYAAGGADLLRAPESRRRTLRETTAALADGSLDLTTPDLATLRTQLLSMHGIGPWTVGYLSMFALGDTDVLLTGDSALRLGARTLGVAGAGSAEVAGLLELGDAVRPWRSYLGIHLWGASGKMPA